MCYDLNYLDNHAMAMQTTCNKTKEVFSQYENETLTTEEFGKNARI